MNQEGKYGCDSNGYSYLLPQRRTLVRTWRNLVGVGPRSIRRSNGRLFCRLFGSGGMDGDGGAVDVDRLGVKLVSPDLVRMKNRSIMDRGQIVIADRREGDLNDDISVVRSLYCDA